MWTPFIHGVLVVFRGCPQMLLNIVVFYTFILLRSDPVRYSVPSIPIYFNRRSGSALCRIGPLGPNAERY